MITSEEYAKRVRANIDEQSAILYDDILTRLEYSSIEYSEYDLRIDVEGSHAVILKTMTKLKNEGWEVDMPSPNTIRIKIL